MLVDGGEPGVVPRLDECLGGRGLVERPDVGEALPSCRDHPHAHAGRLGGGELLDLALEDPDRGLPAVGDVDLDLLVGRRLLEDAAGPSRGAQAPAVPPIVTPVTRRVGCPQPTGTLWPSLPQVPGDMSKSLPMASILESTSGPLPIRLALRERLGDAAVLDQVGLGHPEDEVSGRGVDLPAAELGDVDARSASGRRSRPGPRRRRGGRCWSCGPWAGPGSSGAGRCPTRSGPPCGRGGSPTCSR